MTSGNTPPDYTTILKTDDAEISKRIAAPPTVVPREEYEQAKKEASDAITALAAARAETERKVSQAERQVAQNLPPQMRTYLYDREKAKDHPWEITEIFADDSHTYLRRAVRSNDLPSVYAIGANGKPELIVAHYDPDRDIYVTPQRINAGFLSFGGQKKEKRLTFYLPQGA